MDVGGSPKSPNFEMEYTSRWFLVDAFMDLSEPPERFNAKAGSATRGRLVCIASSRVMLEPCLSTLVYNDPRAFGYAMKNQSGSIALRTPCMSATTGDL